jgi:hypothetical protein
MRATPIRNLKSAVSCIAQPGVEAHADIMQPSNYGDFERPDCGRWLSAFLRRLTLPRARSAAARDVQ